jgi:hypothetical protein
VLVIPAGTRVDIRVTGHHHWSMFVTTRDHRFSTYTVDGDYWVFENKKEWWQMRALCDVVQR